MLAPLGREGAGQVHDTALGGVVRGGTDNEVAHQAVHRSDVDDAAVAGLDHLFAELAGAVERAEEIDVQLFLELLVGDFLSRGHGTRAGVVHQDVHAAEALHRGGHGGLDVLRVGNITGKREHLNTKFSVDGFRIFLQEVHTAGEQHQVGALAREGLGHLEAQAGGRAGHYGDASRKIEIILHCLQFQGLSLQDSNYS